MSSKVKKLKSVVFIPGALCNKDIFADQVANISPYFNSLFIDTKQSATISEMAEIILDKAPLKFALVGISMGGYVALELLRIAPERIWGAVLISTSAKPELSDQYAERESWIDKIKSGKYEEFVNEIVDDCISNNGANSNNAKECFREIVKVHSVDTISRQMNACSIRPDFQESLDDIQCQLLLIGGSDDSDFFISGLKEISERVNGSRILILPNCGHLPTIESANITTKTIKQFLSETAKL